MTSQPHKPAARHSQHAHAPHSPDEASVDAGETCFSDYLSVLELQRGLLGELDALSQRQTLLIDNPEVAPLLGVLDERQQVIDQVTLTSRTVDQLRRQWESIQSRMPDSRREEVRKQVEAVSQLASKVSKRDEQDHARLKKRLDALAGELAGLTTSRQAAAAYSTSANPSPRFQDQQA